MIGLPSFSEQVVSAVRNVARNAPVPLHAPEFHGDEWSNIKECLETTFVSSVGKFVDRFEVNLAEYTGARHAIAVVNGTAALHVAMLLAGVKSNDEVLVPALTFVATANAVSYCGATPHFVDSSLPTLGINVEKLREHLVSTTKQVNGECINIKTGCVIRALIPMHTFGHPCDLEGLVVLAKDFNLALIEDAAESLGSTYHNRHTGTLGLMGVLSFNGNKIITTGGGGALLINDSDLAHRAKHITTTAKLPHAWEYRHDQVGFNYRLPNINAALGCAQLEQMPKFLSEKRRLFEIYKDAFLGIDGVTLVEEPPGCCSNYWLQTILLDESHINLRDEVLDAANHEGLMMRPAWTLLHRLAPFINAQRMDLSGAEALERRIINIPSSPMLSRNYA